MLLLEVLVVDRIVRIPGRRECCAPRPCLRPLLGHVALHSRSDDDLRLRLRLRRLLRGLWQPPRWNAPGEALRLRLSPRRLLRDRCSRLALRLRSTDLLRRHVLHIHVVLDRIKVSSRRSGRSRVAPSACWASRSPSRVSSCSSRTRSKRNTFRSRLFRRSVIKDHRPRLPRCTRSTCRSLPRQGRSAMWILFLRPSSWKLRSSLRILLRSLSHHCSLTVSISHKRNRHLIP